MGPLKPVFIAVLVALAAWAGPAAAEPARVHTVYPGQTLGRIAKRYGVAVDAICRANDIRRRDPIRPGQRLVIPATDDPDGNRARAQRQQLVGKSERAGKGGGGDRPETHTVASGQTLGRIAKRYGVTIDAICRANGIRRTDPIRPGQRLLVPATDDPDGRHAAKLRQSGALERRSRPGRVSEAEQTWKRYAKPAWRRGYITLTSGQKRWSGYVIAPGNKVIPNAREAISRHLASWRTGRRVDIDARLIRLIARVSDTFGGRPIRVVSGYREVSHAAESRHKVGRALDFSIEGVPNWAVRDYLRTLKDVGVGFYPNSSFVHLDVRKGSAYWVDYSKPGERPRYQKVSRSPDRSAKRSAKTISE